MRIASLRGWGWLWLAGALALAPGLARSAEPVAASLPPASAFFQAPNVADALLSPDGRRVALSAHLQGRLGLFVFDLDAPERGPQRVALAGDADIGRFAWVNDERLVFELDDLQARDAASRRLGPGLFSARRDGSELRQLVAQGPTQRQRLLADVPAAATAWATRWSGMRCRSRRSPGSSAPATDCCTCRGPAAWRVPTRSSSAVPRPRAMAVCACCC